MVTLMDVCCPLLSMRKLSTVSLRSKTVFQRGVALKERRMARCSRLASTEAAGMAGERALGYRVRQSRGKCQ